jgi:uncharacterized protein involved in exopolysaccharide biosynthesis
VRPNRAPSSPPDLKDVDRIGPAPDPSSVAANLIDLQPYLEILNRARRFILAALAVGAVAGYLYVWSRPPVFEAAATLLASRSKIGVDVAPSVASPAFRAFIVNNEVVGRVLRDLKLTSPPRSIDVFHFVRDHLQVDQIEQTDTIRVRVRLDDPALAATAANRIVELATALNRRVNTEESVAVRDFIKSQLDDSRARVKSLANELLAFKRDAQIELRRTEVQSLLDHRRELTGLTVQLEGERASLREAERQLATRQRVLPASRLPNPVAELGAPLTSPAGRPPSPSASQLPPQPLPAPATAQPVTATAPTSTAEPPSATSAAAAPLVGRAPDPSKPEFDGKAWLAQPLGASTIDPVYEVLDYQTSAARARVADLEQRRQLLISRYGLTAPTMRELTELYAREMTQARLQSEYDLASQIYSDLFTRYEQARIQVASRSTDLKVLDPAIEQATSIAPSPVIAAVLGGLALGGIATLFVFARAYVRRLPSA